MLTISLLLHRSIDNPADLYNRYIQTVGFSGRRFLSPRVSPYRAPIISHAHYFQVPATQASKCLILLGKQELPISINVNLLAVSSHFLLQKSTKPLFHSSPYPTKEIAFK